MLLHGPPGTGKTLIARQIGKMLNGKEPKVVNGPEVLSKYVGQAEENIRNLFGEAEAEYREKGDASVSYYCLMSCQRVWCLPAWHTVAVVVCDNSSSQSRWLVAIHCRYWTA